MAANICKYIQGCLPCAKWGTAARSVSLTPIQTAKPYELMGRDFIGSFERSAYGNAYIYNLVDYFLSHIYPHSTFGAGTTDFILSFNHYLRANPKPYAVYSTWMPAHLSQARSYAPTFKKKTLRLSLPIPHLINQLV